jgi:cytochrome c
MSKNIALISIAFAAISTVTVPAFALSGDPAKGEQIFKKCAVCHTLEAGKNKIGPSLQGVIGRPAGTAANFNYSAGMKAAGQAGIVWGEDTLDQYLTAPKKFVPGNKMPFPGLPEAQDRADVIAYLKTMMK